MSVTRYGPELETVHRDRAGKGVAFVRMDGPLRAPVGVELRHRVNRLLRRGQTSFVIDLGRVTDLDAAGLGELVHLYTEALAANGGLRLAHVTDRARRLFDVAGLAKILGVESCCYERCS